MQNCCPTSSQTADGALSSRHGLAPEFRKSSTKLCEDDGHADDDSGYKEHDGKGVAGVGGGSAGGGGGVRLRLLLPPLLPDAGANEDEDKGGEEDARRFEA